MKMLSTFLASIMAFGLANLAHAQVYVGSGFAIPDNAPVGAQSSIVISDSGTVAPGLLISLSFNPEHTWVGDLVATLSHNDGSTTVTAELFNRLGKTSATTGFGNGNDLNGTYSFSDSAASSFWLASATSGNLNPGAYRAVSNLFNGAAGPLVSLDAIFGGRSIAGTWTLSISDNAPGDTGSLATWSITNVPTPGALAVLGAAALIGRRRRR